MADDFEDRINHNASFFDGILSLTPVDLYFGRDNSNQWQTKKQPLNKKRDSRLAKLDPVNAKAARDLVEGINPENKTKNKRKREEVDEEDQEINIADGSLSDVGDEQGETQGRNTKKQKRSSNNSKSSRAAEEEKEDDDDEETIEDRKRKKAEKRAEKRTRKNELKAQMKEKKEQQKARKKSQQQTKGDKADSNELDIKEAITFESSSPLPQGEEEEDENDENADNADQASTPSSEDEHSEVFSPQHESGTSSTSSIQQSTLEDTSKPTSDAPSTSSNQPSNLKDNSKRTDTTAPAATPTTSITHDSSTPHERLQAAIQQRRAERKADGTDGRAPKNRQELLEQRRRKEEQRKAAKKEQKRREKEEEARLQDEEIARRFSPGGSGSLLASPRSPVSSGGGGGDNNSFSFGRIAFTDGTHFDPSTADVVDEHRRKGPRDTAAQLKIALAKKNKLSGLDEAKRREIEQKDMWLNAKKRAHGEHVKDDTSLLKKALKRQQGQKKKSEREWTDRVQGVQKAQETRQKKRTENLAKRREDKRSSGGKKVVKRPGFEGSFKGRTGGRKK
ncbi:hypothetical protein H2204_004551 [Knufia peltigerae]|uniref:Ribosomal RNA-processing protein 14/surfeit locus protein 6 C-terminal domain-containing protein n=1 Tax=Knufia peltigerae TaxID=1002370 RepID=A0AA39CYF7_9EURO|nr:hypothetical protein H2204_004551 [Knufia peltigerae]